jgi:hypothetical protein
MKIRSVALLTFGALVQASTAQDLIVKQKCQDFGGVPHSIDDTVALPGIDFTEADFSLSDGFIRDVTVVINWWATMTTTGHCANPLPGSSPHWNENEMMSLFAIELEGEEVPLVPRTGTTFGSSFLPKGGDWGNLDGLIAIDTWSLKAADDLAEVVEDSSSSLCVYEYCVEVTTDNQDTDNDGVLRSDDCCPNTEAGALLDSDGCSNEQREIQLLCPFYRDPAWTNHDEYVQCLMEATYLAKWKNDGKRSLRGGGDSGEGAERGGGVENCFLWKCFRWNCFL